MRISGHVMGARTTVATRISVIFSSEGLEWVLVFCGSASRTLSVHRLPIENRPAVFRNFLRASLFRKLRFIATLLSAYEHIALESDRDFASLGDRRASGPVCRMRRLPPKLLHQSSGIENRSFVSAAHCFNRSINFFRSARYRLFWAKSASSYGSSFRLNISHDWFSKQVYFHPSRVTIPR